MLCVIAKLPEDASEKLRLLRDSALPGERAGAPLYGHITIATYLPEDDGSFAEACVRTIREYSSFTVRYEKLRVLCRTSIIAALPSMTEELVSLHSRVADPYAASLDQWTGRTGSPIPRFSTIRRRICRPSAAKCSSILTRSKPESAGSNFLKYGKTDIRSGTLSGCAESCVLMWNPDGKRRILFH